MRTSSPAPMASITASATSAVTSARRTRWRPAAPPSRAPSFSTLHEIDEPAVRGGRHAEDHAGRDRHRQREQQHGKIHRQLARTRQAGRIGEHQRSKADAGHPDADRSTSDRQQHAFGGRLLDAGAMGWRRAPHAGQTRDAVTRRAPARGWRGSRTRSGGRARRPPAAPRSRGPHHQESQAAAAAAAASDPEVARDGPSARAPARA